MFYLKHTSLHVLYLSIMFEKHIDMILEHKCIGVIVVTKKAYRFIEIWCNKAWLLIVHYCRNCDYLLFLVRTSNFCYFDYRLSLWSYRRAPLAPFSEIFLSAEFLTGRFFSAEKSTGNFVGDWKNVWKFCHRKFYHNQAISQTNDGNLILCGSIREIDWHWAY